MSSSLRKLFTTVWSFLKGLLHSADEAKKPDVFLVHVHPVKGRGRQKAIALFVELLGETNITQVPTKRRLAGWLTLEVRATREEIAVVERQLPRTTNSAVEPVPGPDMDTVLTTRRFQHEN